MEDNVMYNIAICDDDVNYIHELKRIITECFGKEREIRFSEYNSGRSLLESNIDDIDVIFLDIQMQGMNGNETAVRLNKMGYKGILVQCSGIFNPTPETVKISPYRYLLKQDSREKTVAEVKEILAYMVKNKQCYEIEGSYLREKIKFRVADIVYITHHPKGNSVLHLCSEKAGKYSEGNIIVPYGFDKLLQILESADFAIPHNSYIVNLKYVSTFDPKKEIIVADGKVLTISRGKKDTFFKEFANYTRRKYKEKF